jgi:hypothetical protein
VARSLKTKKGLTLTRPPRLIAALAVLGATLALPLTPAVASPRALTQAQAEQVGTDAYVYGIDLLEFVRQTRLDTSVTVPNKYGNAPVNEVGNQRILTTPANQSKEIVGPSNSTLYSNAHLDLTGGPIVLHVPAVPHHRYYAWEFLDPYLNVFHYVGTRTTGNAAGTYVIVGPHFKGKLPKGMPVVRAAYDHVWLFGRTLVYGASDLPAAHRIQDGYKVVPLKAYDRVGLNYTPPKPKKIITTPTAPTVPTGLAFYDALGNALAQYPAPASDHKILAEMATAGIAPGRHPSSEGLSSATLAGLKTAADDGPGHVFSLRLQIGVGGARKNNGWFQTLPDTGKWGTDYAYRAVVAVYGICANRPAEASYAIGTLDNTGAPLNGSDSYRIHFPAGEAPPAKYFWSLTAYNTQTELVANKYDKYSVGSNKGIKYNKDGSLDVYVQPTPPAGHGSNWVPDTPGNQIILILRMYGPSSKVLGGQYHYPTIERVS